MTGVAWRLVLAAVCLGGALQAQTVTQKTCAAGAVDLQLAYGELLNCDIGAPAETDTLRFTAAAGETVLIQATRTGGAGQPTYEVYGPANVRVDAQGSRYGVIARSELKIAASGEYRITVRDADTNETLTYMLFLQRLAPAGATAPTLGEPLNSDLAFPGDVKLFSFNGSSGQTMLVQVTKTAGAGQPYFEIYDSRGTRIDAQGSRYSSIARSERRLSATGECVVRVYDADFNEPVSFQVYVQRLSPPGSSTAMTMGEPISGEIGFAGAVKMYTFTGSPGQVVLVQATKVAGAGQPYMEIYGPTDTRLAAEGSRYSSIARSEVRLTAAGEHVVRVYDADVNEPLSFQVFAQSLVPAPSAAAVTFGQPVTADLAFAGDVKLYSFTGSPGQVVLVQATKVAGAGQPYIEIYAPNSVRVDAQGSRYSSIARSEAQLAAAGQYLVRVYDADTNEPMTFQLYVQRLAAPAASTAAALGEVQTGELLVAGEVKMYTFTGAAGQVFVLQATRTSGAGQPYIEIYGPGNVRLDAQGSRYSTIARSEARLTTAGEHVVRVYDADFNEAMTFQFYAQRVAPPNAAAAVALGQPASAEIRFAGEVKLYTFTGTPGQVFAVQATKTTGAGQPYFEVWGPNNTRLDAQGSRYAALARSEVRLTAAGEHVVRIYDADVNEPLGFQLYVQRLSPPAAVSPLNFDRAVNGAISFAGEVRMYSLGAAAGDVLTIQVTRQSGEGTPYFELYDPNSQRVSTAGDRYNAAARATPTLAASGTHILRLYDADFNQVLAFQALVQCKGTCVGPALRITTASPLPEASVGGAYSQRLEASGGAQPFGWSIVSGALPPGLSLDTASGAITGTPTQVGTSRFTARVTDGVNSSADQAFELTVLTPALAFTSTSPLPDASLGAAYSQGLRATGGTPPYSWSISKGALPPGLRLDTVTGVISGTPGTQGTSAFSVTLTDSARPPATVTKDLQITVTRPAPSAFSFAGLSGTVPPDSQQQVQLSISEPYPLEITGQITVTFTPEAVNNSDGREVSFHTGSQTAAFTIPANSTTAQFGSSSLALRTGTAAGTISVQITGLQAGGTSLDGVTAAATVRVGRSVPFIRSAVRVATSSGFDIVVIGYSTTRDLTRASLRFTASSGGNFVPVTVPAQLTAESTRWFTSSASKEIGGNFRLTVPFTVQGTASDVGPAYVTLDNTQGSSAEKAVTLQ